MLEVFAVDAEAAAYHDNGMRLETRRRDYNGAHEAFRLALERLSTLENTPDVTLQRARIIRDDGFTYVREHIVASNSDARYNAQDSLNPSRNLSQNLLGYGKDAYSEEALAYLNSEHGATIGLLGRFATVRAVLGEDVTEAEQRQLYYEAQGYLFHGSNRYYETSNAVNAARFERIYGDYKEFSNWLKIARHSIGDARSARSKDWLPALRTYVRRLPSLTFKSTARKNVLKLP